MKNDKRNERQKTDGSACFKFSFSAKGAIVYKCNLDFFNI